MTVLAKSYRPDELMVAAFGVYEQFRPAISAGVKGWGAEGPLNTAAILALAMRRR
jgi:hypothetical protein